LSRSEELFSAAVVPGVRNFFWSFEICSGRFSLVEMSVSAGTMSVMLAGVDGGREEPSFSVMRSSFKKILQSKRLGFASEIATENTAGEKKDTIAPYRPGSCCCVVWMLSAPPQCQDRTNHVVTPLTRPKTGDKIAAAFVWPDHRIVSIIGKMPGHATTGLKYVDLRGWMR
jgi:hypothetical protein